jgi:GTP-binding protein
LIEGYISGRTNLAAVVVLIDSRLDEITDMDLQMIDYLRHIKAKYIPVFTKVDKLRRSELVRLRQAAANKLFPDCEPVFFSAVTREGTADLQKEIGGCVS